MNTPAKIPSPAVLGLKGARSAEDVEWLGWNTPETIDILWALSGAGDPDLALNTVHRLVAALDEHFGPSGRAELTEQLISDPALRVRLFALLGGSTALGDHLVAHPELWRELQKPLPTTEEVMSTLLDAVAAQPAQIADPEDGNTHSYPDGAKPDLTSPGTYCAGIGGQEAAKNLRETYRTFVLRIAAHDFAGTYPGNKRRPEQPRVEFSVVTGLLTDLADAALTAALAVAVKEVYGDKPVDTTLAVLAMGKCGARELNYISDVDVIFVAEPANTKATRLAGELNRIGSRCFFEVDAALRPEGKNGALVRTLDSHVAYYQRWAETWEFQALLKARPMTGNIALGEDYIARLRPMVWTASQRDSFVDDVQAMRRRVIENVPQELRERELKLGEGGLRDVEFAVQLLQLVHGRSDESLRQLATVDALHALVEGGYVGREDGHGLIDAYAFLRLLEHRLQLQRLRRTHALPAEKEEHNYQWLARTAGFTGVGKKSATELLNAELKRIRLQVSTLHRRLFYRPLLHSVVNKSVDTLKLTPEAAKLQLSALGYKFPERAFEHLSALASGVSRKAKIQAMLLPSLMDWLSATADPDAGLLNYRKLSEAAHDRTWFLRMLRDEGIVGQRLMHILGTSPYTSDLIISAPDIVRQFGDGATGPKLLSTGPETVSTSLVAAAGRHEDPNKAIAVARSLRRTELARIASADLLGMLSVPEVCLALSTVWDAVLEAALRAEIRYSLNNDGFEQPPARIAVIGMGRLGGAELGYGSDADVMLVAEPSDGVAENDALKWAIKICDDMRQRLNKPSGDPPLEVDLGLRPEGRSGASVRTVGSYQNYYQRWGETWEKQALLRATVIAGDHNVGEKFLHAVDPWRYPEEGVGPATIRDVRRMKARVDNERLPRGADRNTHTKLGRGALTDIEWTVQLLTLENVHKYPELKNTSTLELLDIFAELEILETEKVKTLKDAWLAATQARNALVLVRGRRTDQLPGAGLYLMQVAAAAGWKPLDYQDFLENYLRLTRRARRVVDEVFWGEPSMEP
ncbi:bifunctional [glutamine synthetase] adenylyltransferase/[glutamine synthetase]-adenylyl-L-tyrosine phosphorylase [Corynebacterium poyangense]|uniref:bifunctional [glutamine synthetase] adenylyltransferase/[glutamine synthetase]-adenylyl-L-tyrosine phosphorylase n=1 Tax=Corynebacterium poyangense TaxID=2684405 RepID=UPI003744513F